MMNNISINACVIADFCIKYKEYIPLMNEILRHDPYYSTYLRHIAIKYELSVNNSYWWSKYLANEDDEIEAAFQEFMSEFPSRVSYKNSLGSSKYNTIEFTRENAWQSTKPSKNCPCDPSEDDVIKFKNEI